MAPGPRHALIAHLHIKQIRTSRRHGQPPFHVAARSDCCEVVVGKVPVDDARRRRRADSTSSASTGVRPMRLRERVSSRVCSAGHTISPARFCGSIRTAALAARASPTQFAGRRGSAGWHLRGRHRVRLEANVREDRRACRSKAPDRRGICRTSRGPSPAFLATGPGRASRDTARRRTRRRSP